MTYNTRGIIMGFFTSRFTSRLYKIEKENTRLADKIKTLELSLDLLAKSLSVVRSESTKLFDITTKQGNLDRDLIDKLIMVLKEIRLGIAGKGGRTDGV
jgi:hypothetical protein